MITDRELQDLFGDSSDGNSPKKKEKKPEAKAKAMTKTKTKKSRPPKRKTTISFDPDIFLDGVKNDQETTEEDNDYKTSIFPKNEYKEKTAVMPPEFSNLICQITFYLNSQLHILMDEVISEIVKMVDKTLEEKTIVDKCINELSEAIRTAIDFSTSSQTYQNPKVFDSYSERFRQAFYDSERVLSSNFNTTQIKNLREDAANKYNGMKKYLEKLANATADLSMSSINDQISLLSDVEYIPKINNGITLECKEIELKIISESLAKRREIAKNEMTKYYQFKEVDEINMSITTDMISDMILSIKNTIEKKHKGPTEFCVQNNKMIKIYHRDLKKLWAQYFNQIQNISATSSFSRTPENIPTNPIFNRFDKTEIPHSQINDPGFSSSQISQMRKEQKSRIENSQSSYKKIQKNFKSILAEQNKDLENTSVFLESVKDNNRANMMNRLRKSMFNS